MIIAFIIVIIILTVFYFLNLDSKCINEVKANNIAIYRFARCISLCPLININEKNLAEPSCQFYCSKKYTFGTVFTEKCNKNKKIISITNDFIEEIGPCMGKIYGQLFKKCLDNVGEKISYLKDSTNIQLEPYQKYNLTVENLDCKKSPPEITVKLTEGQDNLKIILYTNGLQNTKSDAPKVGESKTYIIDESIYNPYNLTRVNAALEIDKYIMTFANSKTC